MSSPAFLIPVISIIGRVHRAAHRSVGSPCRSGYQSKPTLVPLSMSNLQSGRTEHQLNSLLLHNTSTNVSVYFGSLKNVVGFQKWL